jgi:RHS repeat-associated protein
MPGGKYSQTNSTYRYGFNGQEKSSEINESLYTAEFWQYDSRIGRRWNKDPIVKVGESPYAAFSNNPVWFSDVNGADTTLPEGDGRNITLPTGVSGISTFDGGVKNLQNSSVTVHPASGTLSSLNINGKQFNAQFGDHTGTFQGYYSGDLSYNDYAAQQAASGNGAMLAAVLVFHCREQALVQGVLLQQEVHCHLFHLQVQA